MTNKKNRFFTLVFSCCPGAGEMYLGLYRQGVSLMGLFFGTIALAAWLGFEELIFFICPIVWCYSFFHTHNLRRMTEEEFAAVEDKFIFADYVNLDREWKCSLKHRRVFGFVSERLLDAWLITNNISFEELDIVYMEHQNWLHKGTAFLKRKLFPKKDD